MNIETLRKEWSRNELNKQAAIDLWDSMAKQYQAFQIPTVDEDSFLELLMRLGALNKEAKVLDVGCGKRTIYSCISGSLQRNNGNRFIFRNAKNS